ncbi:hypothetical protein [Sinorhizobium fredii]|uniref:hypothetical protein n=1 Tax=Rhizobium fredii TaxID=380 RepID=UPI00339138E6
MKDTTRPAGFAAMEVRGFKSVEMTGVSVVGGDIGLRVMGENSKVTFKGGTMEQVGTVVSTPANPTIDFLFDGTTMRQIGTVLDYREEQNTLQITFPADAMGELRRLVEASREPPEQIIKEFVHRKPVLDHIKAHGYDIAQVILALASLFKQG